MEVNGKVVVERTSPSALKVRVDLKVSGEDVGIKRTKDINVVHTVTSKSDVLWIAKYIIEKVTTYRVDIDEFWVRVGGYGVVGRNGLPKVDGCAISAKDLVKIVKDMIVKMFREYADLIKWIKEDKAEEEFNYIVEVK